MPDHENAGSTAGPLPVASAPPQPRRGSDYAELSRQVKQAGLLERRRWNYTWRIAVTVALLAAGWGAFVLDRKSVV